MAEAHRGVRGLPAAAEAGLVQPRPRAREAAGGHGQPELTEEAERRRRDHAESNGPWRPAGDARRDRPPRKRRSREEASRPSSRRRRVVRGAPVRARDGAGDRRAGRREPALVHRYFGTKQNLMRAAMEQSQRAIAANLSRWPSCATTSTSCSVRWCARGSSSPSLARASLDGVLPDFPAGYPTMDGLVRRIEADLAPRRQAAATRASWSPASGR